MTRKHRQLAVVGLTAIWLTGCSYQTDRPFPSNVKTVHVEPFKSRVFRRRIEMRLTEAVKKRITMDTDYRLADQSKADTVLFGEILNVKQGTIGHDFVLNQPRETQLTLVVSFQWKDLRTGEILVDRPRWLQTFDYSRPVGEREVDALNGVCDRMAEQIVEEVMSEW